MFRAFCSLALCCVFSSVGVAQQVQIRPNPDRAQTSATWEYGWLVYVGTQIRPIWLSADTTDDTSVSRMLDSAANQHTQEHGHPGLVPRILVLNILGARGWELVSAQEFGHAMNEVSYVFKREVRPAARTGAGH
jgi:hypothetical protein